MKKVLEWLYAINYKNAVDRGVGGKLTAERNAFDYLTLQVTFLLSYPLVNLTCYLLPNVDLNKSSIPIFIFFTTLLFSCAFIIRRYYKYKRRFVKIINKKIKFRWYDWLIYVFFILIGIFSTVGAMSTMTYYWK